MIPSTTEQQHVWLKVTHSQNGIPLARIHSCGCLVYVSDSHVRTFFSTNLAVVGSVAGAGKSALRYVDFGYNFTEAYNIPFPSHSIIKTLQGMRGSGPASLAIFYCDFRDYQKKDRHGLLSSLRIQLCDQSDAYCAILSNFYLTHRNGSKYTRDSELIQCFKTILKLPKQATTYNITDGLDECSLSTGIPSPRDNVLGFVEDLLTLQSPNLRIYVTSRPSADIETAFSRLAFRSVFMHGESREAQDIAEYIRFVVNGDLKMRAWRKKDNELVIDAPMKEADGM